MSNLAADKVLRVNCPGFGVSSTLPLGEAKPLGMYEVIVINPTSIVHLFEPKSDVAKEAEALIADGVTTLKLDDDSTIESCSAELELREHELRQFLAKGGLLIYFLAPPFTLVGPSMQMDNYVWLYEWAPDKHDGSNRNMSATISGKNIEATAKGKKHPFAPYLEQLGLEWSTIIRNENLAEGYVSLAGAGGPKCVAGYKHSGPKRGQALFLPAPYDTRFDDTLKECILKWYEIHSGPDADKPDDDAAADEEEIDLSGPEVEGQSLMNDLFAEKPAAAAGSAAPAAGAKKGGSLNWPEFDNDAIPFAKEREAEKAKERERQEAESKREPEPEAPPPKRQPEPEPEPEPPKKQREPEPEPEPVQKRREPEEEPPRKREPEPEPERRAEPERETTVRRDTREETKTRSDSGSYGIPDGKELISKMEHELSPNVPEWCSKVSFAELKQLETEMNELHEQVRRAKIKMSEVEERMRTLLELKNSLLALSGVRLVQACSKVFDMLGWSAQISEDSTDELWLKEGDKMQAIVRIVYANGQPSRSEVAELSQSVITYWDRHDIEPKGILLASTYADRPPKHRPDEDFPTNLGDFAKRKNLALITCMQLLTMYRDAAVNEEDPRNIRENLLTTSGVLAGFKIDLWEATPAGR